MSIGPTDRPLDRQLGSAVSLGFKPLRQSRWRHLTFFWGLYATQFWQRSVIGSCRSHLSSSTYITSSCRRHLYSCYAAP